MSAELVVESANTWTIETLESLTIESGLFKDGDWVESKDQDPDGEVRLIQLADIGDGQFIDKSSRFLTKNKAKQLKCTFLKKGDLLIARMPDPLGRTCMFPLEGDEKYVTVVDVCIVRGNPEKVDTRYLMHLINSPDIRAKIDSLKSGSTRKRISRGNLSLIELPIASLEEQKDIVAKIETLFSELDKGIESLKIVQQQLKAYRQAVLKHAFEGKLTEQWRQRNPDKLETPEQLLARIQQEREQRYQQQLEEWKQAIKEWGANGKEGKKLAKPKLHVAVPQLESFSLPALPEGWAWVELSTIMENIQIGPFGSLLHKADYVVDGVPLINPSHIKNQKIIPDWNLTITEEKLNGLRKYVMCINDIVIGRRGEMGRCAVITDKESGWLCGTGSLFIRPLSIANSEFYAWVVSSQRVRDYLSGSSIGTTMQNLNEKILKGVPVPICSIEEQDEIIRQLSSQYSVIEKMEEEIDTQIMRSNTLRQSILKKAFSGQLIHQDCKEGTTDRASSMALVG